MNYFEEKHWEKACMILMKAAKDSVAWIEKGKYRRAELTLEWAMEEAGDLLEGREISEKK